MSEIETPHGVPRANPTRQFSLGLEVEDDRSLLTRVIDTLIRFLKRFISDIADGTAGMSLALGRMHDRAELISTESRSRGRVNRSETFTINTRIKNLCINYKPISDPQQLLMIIKSTDPIFKAYFRYQNLVLPGIIPSITQIDPKNPESVIGLIELLAPVSPISIATNFNMAGDNASRSTVGLLGNNRFHAVSKNSTADAVLQLAGQEWLLTAMSDNPKPLPQSIEYKVFASTIEQSILRQAVSTIADIESNFGIVARNRRGMRFDDLLRYLERMRNASMGNELDAESLERAKQIVMLLEAYSHWMTGPYLDLMGLYIGNTTALLNVCAANN